MNRRPIVETHTVIVTQYSEYRLRPNPDVPEGFNGGAYLDIRDFPFSSDNSSVAAAPGWQRSIYIEPAALGALGAALFKAKEEVKYDD